MKVFNLTDVSTPKLEQNKLVNHTFAVGKALLGPGESGDVPTELEDTLRPEIQRLVSLGVLAVDELPAAYKTEKAKPKEPPKAALTPGPVPPPTPPAPPAEESPTSPGKRRSTS